MSEKLKCKRCDLQFDSSKVVNNKCPHCRRLLYIVSDSDLGSYSYSSNSTSLGSSSHQEASLDDLVRAQTKTTYAVRSISLFVLITTATTIIGSIFYVLYLRGVLSCQLDSVCLESQSRFEYLGPSIAAIGLLAGLVIGLAELRASNPR